MVEFSLGRRTRQGVIGSFNQLMGQNYTWMGGFVAFCTMAIMFYYSVVSGWAIRYFWMSVNGNLQKIDHAGFWNQFITSHQPILFHLIALAIGSFIIYRGIIKGLEKANRIFLPALLPFSIFCHFGLGCNIFFP